MDDKFPLCTKAGLSVHELPLARRYAAGGVAIEQMPYIMAADVERYLETRQKPEQPTAWKFEASDFQKHLGETISAAFMFQLAREAATIANAKLAEWLSAAPVVYGHVKEGAPNWWGPRENGQFDDTHTARLIAIEPIRKDTAESLLREIFADAENENGRSVVANELIDRARRLLGKP